MADLPDEQLDRLLARVGRADPVPSGDGEPALDELALRRLSQGTLDDRERERLIEQLASDRALREAWIESLEERIPLEQSLEGRLTEAVLRQRRGEGLPDLARAGTRRTVTWLALAAGLALAVGIGAWLYGALQRGAPLPGYTVELSGQLSDVRGDEPTAAAIPTYGAASTVQLRLFPDAGTPDGRLRVAAVAPDGTVRRLGERDGLTIEEREGTYRVEGPAAALFGDEAGRWVLAGVLEPQGRAWSEAQLTQQVEALAVGADEPRSVAADGGRQIVVVPLDYTP